MAVTGLALAGVAWPLPVSAEAGSAEQKTYIVQMAPAPVATYEGDVAGLATTKPQQGEKIDPRSTEVTKYVDHLRGRHDAALKKAGGGRKLYDYVYSYGGFAAKLTESQAARLRSVQDVVAVTEDRKVTVETSSTPAFLGLDDRDGLWRRAGGTTGHNGAGEGLVIGVIDTGVAAASRSFAGKDASGKPFHPVRGFHGECAADSKDASWQHEMCNGKVVAARHFNAGWGGDEAVKAQLPWEFASPYDYNGHGSHTASTAGGNHGVAASGAAQAFGAVSGIAPRARIAAYKALWSVEDASTANGYYSDLVAAIDQAVADGVDVINYSVSGTRTDFLDPAEMAFLSAAEAGVFVAASAGNEGPAASTVAHPSPWVTTVAAGTHNRAVQGSVTLGDGTAYSGSSLAAKAGPAPFVDATAVALPGANPTLVAQCYAARDNGGEPVLDPEKVKGKIVLCDRGVTARLNKSVAVAEAGGVGMVLANVDHNSLNADLHVIPTVHISDKDRQAVKTYAASDGATATIDQAKITTDAPAPYVAAFSSRGPLGAGGGDLLKPDLMAPGQDILAATAPAGNNGAEFGIFSGTSMAAPHVAGLAALLKDLNPRWSPMAIKSALMTSGTDILDGKSTDPSVIFSQGAGHVAPNTAADPGLVYDSGIEDWIAFLCATTKGVSAEICDALAEKGHSLDPSDMNGPSIAVGRLTGTQTVTREVTNVGRGKATYTAAVTGLDGVTTTVTPDRLTLRPGQTKSFKVSFTGATAPLNGYLGGQLTWSDRRHDVRIPLVVRPVQETWGAVYGGAGATDTAEYTALDPKGERLYVAGASYEAVPGVFKPRFGIVAYDAATGAEAWNATYVGPGGTSDEPSGIEVSPDGSKVFVTGLSEGDGTKGDGATIAYEAATGKELWVARHNGAANAVDHANALAVAPDGKSVYVTGFESLGVGGKDDYFTIAYDAETGRQSWLTHFDGPGAGTDDPRAIKVGPDGSKVFVTGQSRGVGTGLTDWGTVAYDAATGEQLWTAMHNGTSNGIDISTQITPGADGKAIYVSGTEGNTGTGTDLTTIAYDTATGTELWTGRYDGPAHKTDTVRGSALAPDGGRLYVIGNTEGAGTQADYTTVAYDTATGRQLWAGRHNGPLNGMDIPKDVAVTPDGGRVVVTGQSVVDAGVDFSGAFSDFVTIAYDAASGQQVWLGQYDGPIGGSDDAYALAVDTAPDVGTRIFVTGSTMSGGEVPWNAEIDFGTVAYFEPWKP
ncbi:S8 family serine peptidase [Nonomuraea sp. K274]|uniref:S8 family serine peptidase n=1 Tax=Nonomuraea cypriaca TaxID=1187855 RepID=A0A931AB26_9ACTN|nr:S8 family serine peptidase [Nonomuraea cypriaca]MBF8186824.1 S8 family serine peptidase [Nonomuraea cypriaca]